MHNIALDRETLTIHSDRRIRQRNETTKYNETKTSKNNGDIKRKAKRSIQIYMNKELLIMCHNELYGKKSTGLDGVTKAEYDEREKFIFKN